MKPYILLLLVLCSCRNRKSNAEEIKDTFDSVNATLSTAVKTTNPSVEAIMDSIDERTRGIDAYSNRSTWKTKAEEARHISSGMINYLEEIKENLKKVPQDDLTAVETLMIRERKGNELYKKLQQYNTDLLNLDTGYHSLNKNNPPIDLASPKTIKPQKWEEAYFKSVPVFAAITMLSKFQNDIRNAEMKFIQYCFRKVSG